MTDSLFNDIQKSQKTQKDAQHQSTCHKTPAPKTPLLSSRLDTATTKLGIVFSLQWHTCIFSSPQLSDRVVNPHESTTDGGNS